MSQLRLARPGQPVVFVVEHDRDEALTQRQREILATVRAFGGNRSRAARHLGVTVQCVQGSLRLARLAGCRVPTVHRRGPDLRPRRVA